MVRSSTAIYPQMESNSAIPFSEDTKKVEKLENKLENAVALLEECRLQIEYLHAKFRETGTGNKVLSDIDRFLKQ